MLIDVMGFSAQIAQPERRDRLAGIYNRIVSDLQLNAKISVLMRIPRRWPRDKAEELQHRSWLRHVRIFSDSLFFFYDAGARRRGEVSIDPTFLDFEAAMISRLLWIRGVPHRGAIAHGEVLSNSHVFLGSPIVHAHQWEQVQNWMGISVVPTSEKEFTGLLAKRPQAFRTIIVPTKGGPVLAFALNIFAGDFNEYGTEDQVAEGFVSAFRAARDSGRVEALPRYVETVRAWRRFGAKSGLLAEIEPGNIQSGVTSTSGVRLGLVNRPRR